MREQERARIEYAPHLQYIKDLIFSEGERQVELPSVLEAALAEPPSILETRLEDLASDLDGMMDHLLARLKQHPDYEKFVSGVHALSKQDQASFSEGSEDLEFDFPAESSLYKVLYWLRQDIGGWMELLQTAREEVGSSPEEEAAFFSQWAKDEVRQTDVEEELRALTPYVPVNNPDPKVYDRYMKLREEVRSLRRSNYMRRSDPLMRSLPSVRRQVSFYERISPRLLELTYGAIRNDIKGDPTSLLVTVLDIALSPSIAGVRSIRETLSALISVFRAARQIRRFAASSTMGWVSFLLVGPARTTVQRSFMEVRSFRRRIFDPLSGILDLLMEVEDRDGKVSAFASSALDVMERIDNVFIETNRELERFSLSTQKGVEDSLAEIDGLKRLEGYLAMLERTLVEIDKIPRAVESSSARRQMVERMAQEGNWRRRYDPSTRAYIEEDSAEGARA